MNGINPSKVRYFSELRAVTGNGIQSIETGKLSLEWYPFIGAVCPNLAAASVVTETTLSRAEIFHYA